MVVGHLVDQGCRFDLFLESVIIFIDVRAAIIDQDLFSLLMTPVVRQIHDDFSSTHGRRAILTAAR